MSIRWFALMLLCLAVLAAGCVSARAAHIDTQQTHAVVLPMDAVVQSPDLQPRMVADVDHDDADCDDGVCPDGHCKHGCSCGCDMGTCATPSGALLGQPWTFPVIAATDALAPLIALAPATTRASLPLRPPIA